MKLVSCHINNFGALHNKDINFNKGMTCFCDENGKGKSTFAAFIRAMLYGMPTNTKRSRDFNDREHYYPFAGGQFGGSLVIEKGGKEYRIERIFDKRSEKSDELKIIDGKGDFINCQIPGEFFFEIDEESFSRTAFVTSKDIDISNTVSINHKLNNFVDNTNEENNFDKIILLLTTKYKCLKADRGNKGTISTISDQIYEKETGISNLEKTNSGLSEKYTKLNALDAELNELKQKSNDIRRSDVLCSFWQHYDSITCQEKKKTEQSDKIMLSYPCGIPEKLEADKIKMLSANLNTEEVFIEQSVFPLKKEEDLRNLNLIFVEGVPSDENLSEINDRIGILAEKESKLQYINDLQEKNFAARLHEKFIRGVPDDKSIEEKKKLCEKITNNEKSIEQYEKSLYSEISVNVPKKKTALPLIFTVIGFCLLAIGVLICFFDLSTGIILTVAAIFLLLIVNRINIRQPVLSVNPDLQRKIIDMKSENEKFIAELRPFCYEYGIQDKPSLNDFVNLANDKKDYSEFIFNREKAEKEANDSRKFCDGERIKIMKFFKKYCVEGNNLTDLYMELIRKKSEYVLFEKEKTYAGITRTKHIKDHDEIIKQINEILIKYELSVDNNAAEFANKILSDIKDLQRLHEDAEYYKTEAEKYKTEKGLTNRPLMETSVNNQQLNDLIHRKEIEQNSLSCEIKDDELQLETLHEIREEVENLKILKENKENEYRIIKKTIGFFEDAENSLREKYVGPIESKYKEYIDRISNDLGCDMGMNFNFEITYDKEGAARNSRHLSSGQRTCMELCLRFSMIENMYISEKPFVIMDDPFANLDEKHLANSIEVTNELSREIQILYFCCHHSREIKTVDKQIIRIL